MERYRNGLHIRHEGWRWEATATVGNRVHVRDAETRESREASQSWVEAENRLGDAHPETGRAIVSAPLDVPVIFPDGSAGRPVLTMFVDRATRMIYEFRLDEAIRAVEAIDDGTEP